MGPLHREMALKRGIAALVVAFLVVPMGGSALAREIRTDKLDCLFYQTFREREITDCL